MIAPNSNGFEPVPAAAGPHEMDANTELSDEERGPTQVKDATLQVRMGFVRKVYGILSAQLLLTVIIAAPLQFVGMQWLTDNSWIMRLSMVVTMMTMCAMICCQKALRSFPTNYIFLLVFTTAMGVMVGFYSALYTWQSVCMAAGITVLIFIAMTAFAWNSTRDFTGCGPYLFAALATLVIFSFTLSLLGFFGIHIRWMVVLYDIIGVLLFTFYIVYDTQLILGEWGGHKHSFSIDDYTFAALNLYLDIINLFMHILSLLGDRR
eukprot:CAMPEP_0170581628 /NCGR_PEP_ID=MMETSP0224-20130122/7143_1 /TAXON_ID=285029 /ORGANISM="Togula jolla, Strain CCCM 725" /LENGTH=263 /DNA_ID=CAMNT_0010904781 /DNA_START=33 /DNA_END=824 /DNA_ORIENTATION=-